MDAPPVQYVTTSDGYGIAYGVSGEGRPLLFAPALFSHVQLNWQEHAQSPGRRLLLAALSTTFRVVQFDQRGQGMSARHLTSSHTAQDVVLDMEAVVDRLGLEQFVLFGGGGGSHHAVRYAVSHPERVEALVLMACPVLGLAWPSGLFELLPNQNWDFFLQSQLPPGLTQDEVQKGVEMLKQITNEPDWQIGQRAWGQSDLSDILPRVRTPTLVLHARQFSLLPAEESMKSASLIANARMVLVDGSGIFGDVSQTVHAIEQFLADLTTKRGAFTDTSRTGEAVTFSLSTREIEVLRLLAAGRSNQQIADELVISLNTVRRHVSNVFDKTGVANRAQAAVYAKEHGIA